MSTEAKLIKGKKNEMRESFEMRLMYNKHEMDESIVK
jgi:hypothetical protein